MVGMKQFCGEYKGCLSILSASMPRTPNQGILSVDRLKRQCRLLVH